MPIIQRVIYYVINGLPVSAKSLQVKWLVRLKILFSQLNKQILMTDIERKVISCITKKLWLL
ncbi:hypothetical protein D3C76_1709180 [compost metagenome]